MSWAKLFNRKTYPEFSQIKLTNLLGKIPNDINGVLYKNTAVCFERNGEIRSHWFDGDGAILKLQVQKGEITASYKFIQTESYLRENQEKRFISANLGSLGKTWLERLRSFQPANRSNTSVLPVEGKLLTLWEGGLPYNLDLDTLQTIGLDNLNGTLKSNETFSAHPKVDPETGLIYNIGFNSRRILNVMKCDKYGRLIHRNQIKLNTNHGFIHDCCLAGKYLLFFNCPFNTNILPFILRRKPLLDSLEWDKNKPTEIVIVDKDSLELVSKVNAHNFFSFHFSNGFTDESGNIIVDHVEYDDVDILMKYTKDIVSGDLSQSIYNSSLVRLTIDPLKNKLLSRRVIYDKRCEFPVVKTKHTGKDYENCYVTYSNTSSEFSSKIANINIKKECSVERFRKRYICRRVSSYSFKYK